MTTAIENALTNLNVTALATALDGVLPFQTVLAELGDEDDVYDAVIVGEYAIRPSRHSGWEWLRVFEEGAPVERRNDLADDGFDTETELRELLAEAGYL